MSDSFLKLRNYFSNTIYSQIFVRIRTVAQVSLPQKLILCKSSLSSTFKCFKNQYISYKKRLVICEMLEAVSCKLSLMRPFPEVAILLVMQG